MNRNYQKELDRIIEKRGNRRPRVLLHGCCAPCSSSVLEYLSEYFDLTLLWYNPNIYPQEEFDRRLQALVQLMEDMGLADRVSILAEPWKSEDYYKRIQENERYSKPAMAFSDISRKPAFKNILNEHSL